MKREQEWQAEGRLRASKLEFYKNFSRDQLKEAAEAAKAEVDKIIGQIYRGLARQTELHRTMFKGASVVAWKRAGVPLPPKNLFPKESLKETPKKPLSQIADSEQDGENHYFDEEGVGPDGQQHVFCHGEMGELGIYMDMNSTIYELDEST